MPIRRSPNGARHVRSQPGRNRPERVVAINRNAWSQSVGTGGRNHPVRAVTYEAGQKERAVVIEWDSVAQAVAAHDSPAYQAALAVLGDGAVRDFRIVEGDA